MEKSEYILSEVKFGYPTVLQGLQSLIGVLVMFLWSFMTKETAKLVDTKGLIVMMPSLLLYVATIISGSKALASVPVAVFLCGRNVAAVCGWLSVLKSVGRITTFWATFTIFTFFALIVNSNLLTFQNLIVTDSSAFQSIVNSAEERFILKCMKWMTHGWRYGVLSWMKLWLIGHVLLLASETLYSRADTPGVSSMNKIYYCYCFSVVVLIPASVYTDEATSAIHFIHQPMIEFYGWCLLSGVCGALLQLHKLLRLHASYQALSMANAFAVLLVPLVFGIYSLPISIWQLLAINFISISAFNCFVKYNFIKDRQRLQQDVIPI